MAVDRGDVPGGRVKEAKVKKESKGLVVTSSKALVTTSKAPVPTSGTCY